MAVLVLCIMAGFAAAPLFVAFVISSPWEETEFCGVGAEELVNQE